MHNKNLTEVQYLGPSAPDGKATFFLFWKTDYIPGQPLPPPGEHLIRAQIFRAIPAEYGLKAPEDVCKPYTRTPEPRFDFPQTIPAALASLDETP